MTKEGIHVALLGLGTVGAGVYKVTQRQKGEMLQKLNTTLYIDSILVRNIEKHKDEVDDPKVLTTSFDQILEDPKIDIVVELMGGESKYSRNIRSQARRLTGLTQNLLTLARVDEAGTAPALAPVSLSALALEELETFRAPAELRESFDLVTSRAVARLNLLCELCLPFVKTGGLFVAMKGPGAAEELDEAKKAIRTLGGELECAAAYTIPGTEVRHTAILIRKVGNTPARYPRRWAQMKKQPL